MAASTNELELLENVELRFALAESDAQLEKAVNTFLVPVILKLDSPAQNVRPKVMSILTHINKRIKSKSNISLPISPLLEVFSRSEGSALVKNFALIYIEMGFERINSTEQIPILKQLVHGFASRNEMQKTTLFHIIVQILTNMNVNHMDIKLPIMSQVEDYAQLLQRFVDLMLYHSMKDAPVPSMSKNSIAFVTNNAKAKWSSSVEELRKAKISVLAFVSHCFPDNIPVEDSTTTMPLPDPLLLPRFLVLTAGSCDPNTQISDSAENGSRRIGRKPDFESEQFCQRLYKLYQGDSQVKQTQDADYRYPGSIQIKSKVLQLISRSIKAANMFPQMIQVVFDSLYGEQTTPKLRVAGMIFAQWIARMAAKETLTVVAPVIMVGLLKYLNEHFQEPGMDAENVRGSTYVCVGLVGKRAPQSLDLATLKLFFERLSTESSNVRISVQEALSNMLDAYHPSNRTYKDGEWESVLNLLETCALHTEHHCRFSALKFMNHLLPLSSPTRIYYNLLLSNDPKLEVREESKTGLSFSSHSDCTTLPSFSSVASLIISKPKNTNTQTRPGRHVPSLGLSSDVVYSAISYLRKLWICLADESVLLKLKSAEADGTGDIEDTLLDDPETREKVKKWMNTSWNELDAMEVDTDKSEEGDGVGRGLKLYLQIVEGSISLDVSDSSLQLVAATCLKELVSLGPSSFASRYTHKIEWLKAFLKEPSVKTATKQHVAHILGIVSTSLPDVILPLITDIFKLLSSQIPVDNHFGLVVALGYILGRTYYRYSQNHSKFIPTDVQEKILKHVIDDLDESDTLKQLGGIIALGEIGKYGQIPLALPSSSDVPTTPFESHILPKLQKITKASTKNSKLISSAISTTAYVTLSNPSPRNAILSYLYTLSTTFPKEIEIQFTVGESLCIIAAGWEATNARVHLDLADVSIETKKLEQDKIDGKEVMEEVIQFCFDELKGPKKMVRKAVCIWLLSLVKFAKSNEIIKKNLRNFHAAFSSLLGDRDEFTQEVASKGIGLVYDLGDQSIRDDLVSTLVQTLSEGKKVTEVTADTQLFENLGTTPDGSSLSTYQSILSLATEMNQPDLVYKFMSLASHNQLWNSRIGGAFGFSTILSKAEDELKPFLGTLIPKLFRYRFDPNERVQAAMGSIWKTLVKDPSKTVEEYFEPILKELMTGLMSRLWRVREASCLALSDLLSGKTLSQILATGQLVELWSNAFRALDDIKESVRAAALKTCRTFATLTIRFCDPTNVSIPEGTKIMNIVIPFLLHKGLLNDAEDVRKFSLKTILKICEKGGVLLQPHISEIVGILLECLASLEPQVMNYLSFHAEKYDVSQEQLENTRLFATKNSPMMSGLESLIDHIDDNTMEAVSEKLIHLIRKAVGLPTKGGTARFICILCMKRPIMVKPHAEKILKALSGTVSDRSPAVRKSMAVSIGYIARLVPDATLVKLFNHLKKGYIDNDDADMRSMCPITFLEVSKHATDNIKRVLTEVIPLAYYGCHDSDKEVKKVWNEVWEANTAGTSNALRLYLKEIVELASDLLSRSASWNTKKQAALTIADLAKTLGSDISSEVQRVLPLLMESLSGRLWDGKEALLEALVVSCLSCKEQMMNEPGILNNIVEILIRESKKSNKNYRRQAIDLLGQFVDSLDINVYDEVSEFLVKTATIDDEEDEEDEQRSKPLSLLVKASSFKCLGKILPRNDKDTQASKAPALIPVLSKNLSGNVWNVRLAVLESLDLIVSKLDVSVVFNQPGNNASTELYGGLFLALEDMKYSALRTAAVQVVEKLTTKLLDNNLVHSELKSMLIKNLDVVIQRENIPAIQDIAKDVRRKL